MNEENKKEVKKEETKQTTTPQANTSNVAKEAAKQVEKVEEKKPVASQNPEPSVTQEKVQTPAQASVQKEEPKATSQAPAKPQQSTNTKTPAKKGGNFKYVMTVFLFIALFAMIFFLPDISAEMKKLSAEKKEDLVPTPQVVNSGVMSCTLSKASGVHETTATIRFRFTDKKLKSTVTETSTVINGNAVGEEASLIENQYNSCTHLKEVVENIEGFDASCEQGEKTQTTTETVDYETLDRDAITENIAEFEGNAPEFQLDQDIDDIRSIMESSGYNCEQAQS